jgi:protein SCO1
MSGPAMNKITMNKITMNKITISLFALLLLQACNSGPAQLPFSSAPLAGAAIGGAFTLTDQDGKARSYDEFNGKYRIVYFGYTNCPDICTPDMQNLMAGLKMFEKAHPSVATKIQPIFITVDPARDTPAVLKQFVTAFHPRLIGLSGSEAQTADAAKKFAVYYAKVPGGTQGSYVMSHSQTPYLMGPDGKPLAILPADTPQTPDNDGAPDLVAAELAKWVR